MTNYSIVDSKPQYNKPIVGNKITANNYIVEYDHSEKSSIVDKTQVESCLSCSIVQSQ